MDRIQQLTRYGLFDANVPRYTSYPPANHFVAETGQKEQVGWLNAVPDGAEISLYVHIPFCHRLCWFCACRTQGTRSLRPVAAYMDVLRQELLMVRRHLPRRLALSRLHLGGGTPTILDVELMNGLLDSIFAAFEIGADFEFSVEIDPTAAAPELLDLLTARGMNRASIGVQDFDEQVQTAIGRLQSYSQTYDVIRILRDAGLRSLNMDLLYGLPYQTSASLSDTLQKVMALQPDRLALYGYAHVPWMSKRQVMIDDSRLPSPRDRFDLSELARTQLVADGYAEIGIDHFARPEDSLTIAQRSGRLRRNFQGYTDDPAACLIGIGASAISRFPQGYVQNATATSAYAHQIGQGQLAGQRGYAMTTQDQLVAELISQLMCDFCLDLKELIDRFPGQSELIKRLTTQVQDTFNGVWDRRGDQLYLHPEAVPLARVIAASLDQFQMPQKAHSAAI